MVSKILCACFTPNDKQIDSITKLAKKWNIQGVIYYTLLNCHNYNVEAFKVERALKTQDLPILKIETDYSIGDSQ